MPINSTPELTVRAIEKALLAGDNTHAAIAKQFKVSVPTVRRILAKLRGRGMIAGANADVIKQVAIAQLSKRVEDSPSKSVKIGGGITIDRDELLTSAIAALSADIASTPARSKEGAAAAMAKLLELHAKFNPMTMRELVTVALNLPNFNPREFAQLLKQELDKAS